MITMKNKQYSFLIMFLFPLFSFTERTKPHADGLLLSYNFNRHLPLTFDVSKSSAIIVGDGHCIYKFDASGKLVLRAEVPNTNYASAIFTKLTVDNENENICTVEIAGHIIAFNILSKKVLSDVKIYGSDAKKDLNGNYYSLFQYYQEKKDHVENKLKVVEPNGESYNYNTSIDLGADNFQIINNNIVLYVQNQQSIYFLPAAGKNYGHVTPIKTNLPDDKPVKTLGMVDNKYIFQYFDYNKKEDVINIYDGKMQFVKQATLQFNLNELSGLYRSQDNGDWLSEFPSGNIYMYSNNSVYLMRTTKKGTFIYKLNSLIKI